MLEKYPLLLNLILFMLHLSVSKGYNLKTKLTVKHEFAYILNPGHIICQKPPFLLIYVHSSPENFKNRILIRDTYSKRSEFNDIRLIFMLGQTPVSFGKILFLEYNGLRNGLCLRISF